MPGKVKGGMKIVEVGIVLAPHGGIRNLLGVNQASQVESRNQLGAIQRMVMITVDMVGVDLDEEIEAEGEEEVLVIVDPHGAEEVTEMMSHMERDLKIAGTHEILMVAEEEEEDALAEVIAIKVITMVRVTTMTEPGALAGETGTRMVAKIGTEMMTEDRSVKIEVVAGPNLRTGMPTKDSPAGGVTKMTAGERQNLLVEMTRQEKTMEDGTAARARSPKEVAAVAPGTRLMAGTATRARTPKEVVAAAPGTRRMADGTAAARVGAPAMVGGKLDPGSAAIH